MNEISYHNNFVPAICISYFTDNNVTISYNMKDYIVYLIYTILEIIMYTISYHIEDNNVKQFVSLYAIILCIQNLVFKVVFRF